MTRLLAIGVFIFSSATRLWAVQVSGTVQDGGGQPVNSVDVDFIDTGTGQEIPIAIGDTTNAAGEFTVDVPTGTYDITYAPPLGLGLAGTVQEGVVISGDTTLPAAILPAGFGIQLRAVDRIGEPVAGINARFEDAVSQVLFTPNNTSGPSGAISTVIPQAGGPFTIRLRDVGALGFADKELINFAPAADVDLGDIVVGPAQPLVGTTVQFGTLAPVANVDIDAFDDSGLEVAVSADISDGSGNFAVSGLSDGSYDLVFQPPLVTGLAELTVQNVPGESLPTFGNAVLGAARTVSGRTVDGLSNPLQGIDLDFRDQNTSLKVDSVNDDSQADGTFGAQIPQGLYSVEFRPLSDPTLAPLTLFDVDVTSDVNLGDVVLGAAITLSGRVSDWRGVPLANADLDVFDPGRGLIVSTPGDVTDANGDYVARFASGSWDLVFNPPPNRPDLAPASFTQFDLTADQTLDVTLPPTTAALGYQLYR